MRLSLIATDRDEKHITWEVQTVAAKHYSTLSHSSAQPAVSTSPQTF